METQERRHKTADRLRARMRTLRAGVLRHPGMLAGGLAVWVCLCGVWWTLTMHAATGQAPPPPEQPALTPAEQVARAADLRAQLRWDEALGMLDGVVARAAEDRTSAATAQLRIGQYLLELKRLPEAETAFRAVAAGFADQVPIATRSRVELINVPMRQGNFDAAQAAVDSLLSDTQGSPEFQAWARLKAAEVLFTRGSMAEAEPILRQVVQTANPASEPLQCARIRLAQSLAIRGLRASAITVAESVMVDHAAGRATDKQVAWALLCKGRALVAAGKHSDAVPVLQASLDLARPQYPWLVYDAETLLAQALEAQALSAQAPKQDPGPSRQQSLAHAQAAYEACHLPGGELAKACEAARHVAALMEESGMGTRAAAWLRREITNPTQLKPAECPVADRVGRVLPPETAESWYRYLLAPSSATDPTASLVQAEFGAAPAAASAGTPNEMFARQTWLGCFLKGRNRMAEAKAALEQVLSLATADFQRAETLVRLARCERWLNGKPAARQVAARAEEQALLMLSHAQRDGDAHYAIDIIAAAYKECGLVDDMLGALQRQVAALSPTEHPSWACFARFSLAQEYRSNRRDALAKPLIEETLSLFLDRPFGAGHDALCGGLLVQLALLRANERDLAGAQAAIDQIEQRWPEQYRETIDGCRQTLQTMASTNGQEK
jgi:tetratricopeptide (TPR) repeat protein